MHGVIISNLKKYVEEKLGEDAWDTLRDKAGLPGKAFIPISMYPDSDLEDLLAAAGDSPANENVPLLYS